MRRRLRNQHPERKRKQRDLYFRRTYGISADEVDAMLGGAGRRVRDLRAPAGAVGVAARGSRPRDGGTCAGFLCVDCNQGLGKFRDDP